MFDIINHKLFKMKKIFLIVVFNFSLISGQEVFMLQPIKVPLENQPRFEIVQKEYAAKLAKKAVDRNDLSAWVLLKRVPELGGGKDGPDYTWVHLFDSPKSMANRKAWWTYEKDFGMNRLQLYGAFDWESLGDSFYKTEMRIDSDLPAKYIIFNWATPKSQQKNLEIQKEVEKQFRKYLIKSGMTGWGMASRIAPQGRGESTNFWWDGYDKIENVYKHLMMEGPQNDFPKGLVEEFNQNVPNGWDSRMVFEILLVIGR